MIPIIPIVIGGAIIGGVVKALSSGSRSSGVRYVSCDSGEAARRAEEAARARADAARESARRTELAFAEDSLSRADSRHRERIVAAERAAASSKARLNELSDLEVGLNEIFN